MLFFHTSRSVAQSGILRGLTDCHSHLLPGVDDGVRTLEESLQILDGMERQGVRKVWLTPHIMEDVPNTTDSLRTRFRELEESYGGSIELALAAENMLDSLFEERLEKDDVLPLHENGRRCLLVETSCFNPPMNLHSLLQRIRSRGYHPLLAHPERYVYMEMPDYRELREEGVIFQLNLPSLTGMYGGHVQKKAASLLKAGMYGLTGSDMHKPLVFREWLGTRLGNRDRDMLWAHFPACRDAL